MHRHTPGPSTVLLITIKMHNYFSHGKLERTEGSSITEGIGQGRVTNNVSGAPIDSAVMISDEEAVTMVRGIILIDLFICKVV